MGVSRGRSLLVFYLDLVRAQGFTDNIVLCRLVFEVFEPAHPQFGLFAFGIESWAVGHGSHLAQ